MGFPMKNLQANFRGLAKGIVWLASILLMAFPLAGCGVFSKATPQALPTIVLGSNSSPSAPAPAQGNRGEVTASGIVGPAQEAVLVFSLGGKVETVNAGVGDRVEVGQVLARLSGNEQLQAALSAAELDLLTAQQALEDLEKPQPLKIAQAQVALDQAKTALNDLLHPPETALQQAQKAVLDAQDAVDTAQKQFDTIKYGRASQGTIAAAQAAYTIAQEEVNRLQKIYDRMRGDPAKDAAKALALSALEAAKVKRDRALANLNWLTGKPNQEEIDQKNNDLALAKAQLADAQTNLEKLTNPSAADIALAQATVKDAQQTLDELMAGPDPDQMALYQARLKSAQDQAEAARASLANLELKAPFSGTISTANIHNGEWVLPGQPVMALADLDHLLVKTTDLSELDIPQIEIGQPVAVSIKALGQDVTGRVSAISPLAGTLGGDVVYETTIVLDTIPQGLRAGMSVEVQFMEAAP